MFEKETAELVRPKALPFSSDVLERILKQSQTGTPEVSAIDSLRAKNRPMLKTEFYLDEKIYSSELILFEERAAVAGFQDQVRSPGDHLVCRIRDRELIVLRDEKNALRAYYNSCIHRGTRLLSAKKEGLLKKIVCPYHSWTYALDGKLLTSDCKVPERGLRELPIRDFAGILFVGFQKNALDRLEPVFRELKNFEFDSYVPYEIKITEGNYNWKVGVEIFLESYHISTVHKSSVAAVIPKNASIFDPIGEHGRILIPNRSFENASPPTRKDLIITYFLFPSTLLVIFRDHFAMIHFQPISREKTVCTQAILIPQKSKTPRMTPHWDFNSEFFFRTISEDLALAEEIQFGLKREGFIFPSSWEPGIFHFHRSLEGEK
ncbi:aromatic ring-hydroxylating dioxygenase subunit alpha [Leptospira sp. 201903070]|uniref:Aromatic ring-hydroxylating dioxygenase subunit alpha n=1 Tax=Leptospira ainlahdjerensis TaxID=2810033 RepID=A0ABS2UEL4_9LEPT|nr:aromatic ring-hydroxylating dioxygenase subunit alpha [Leptospira ainlahdjerensis]MBM9578812.1 aromatic ring-hydroxylating dioxygenase subunit alpha [Leptospira ainlahdjerensis]